MPASLAGSYFAAAAPAPQQSSSPPGRPKLLLPLNEGSVIHLSNATKHACSLCLGSWNLAEGVVAAHLTHDTPVAVAVTSFYFRIRHSHMRFPALASTNMSCHTERDSAAHHKYLQGHPSKLKKFIIRLCLCVRACLFACRCACMIECVHVCVRVGSCPRAIVCGFIVGLGCGRVWVGM